MYYKYIMIAVLFSMGAYFVLNYSSADFKEALTMSKNTTSNASSNKNCPNVLVQKGSKIYLYNSSKHMVPGVNPVTFNNLFPTRYRKYMSGIIFTTYGKCAR